MSKNCPCRRVALFALLALLFGGTAWAQVSATQAITLNATKPESISITVTSGSTVNFTLNGGTSTGSPNPTWTTSWNLSSSSTPVCIAVYLPASLSNGTDTIPAANVLGQPEGAGGYAALTGSACSQTNALQIKSVTVNGTNNKNGSSSDSVGLEINETGLTLSTGTYTGTLDIYADAP